jgi:hypothetical protein
MMNVNAEASSASEEIRRGRDISGGPAGRRVVGNVTPAAVLVMLVGIVNALAGLYLIVSSFLDNDPSSPNLATIIWAIGGIVSGVGLILRQRWGRVIAIALFAVSLVISIFLLPVTPPVILLYVNYFMAATILLLEADTAFASDRA